MTDDEATLTTVRDRLTAAGLSEARIDDHMTVGRLRVDGESSSPTSTCQRRQDRGSSFGASELHIAGFTPGVLADALGDAARVMRVLEDWTAVRLWLIVTLVAGCGAAEVTEPVFALVGGASGDSPRSCSRGQGMARSVVARPRAAIQPA